MTALVLASACSPATRGCRGAAETIIKRSSAGPAPYPIARVEVYGSGCVRYLTPRIDRCLCEQNDALAEAVATESIEEAINALQIAPRTVWDNEHVAVHRSDVGAARAMVDLSPRARVWLAALDAALRALVGPRYVPLGPSEPTNDGSKRP